MCTFYELKSLKMQATTQYFGKLVPVQACADSVLLRNVCETVMHICCGTELLQVSSIS
jgi:hypothetical protein